ncbi:uncharacterized protein RHOBADRAFT_64491 [Rhodotorula graminis WP1]|uniref:Uncharacterized protein n=1 Tax=Rhodotorula graminis (strain WP1) TaxID=578459 RepID=A0A194SA22_RHOGW|nr:uncharacterized protein RHOBADRAFT_64491 [Rhodotorula graminis WP1]KPV77452.1 hypothetical protein RHOBADRAFT_64491 [Rhodotorula graminis WP1]
MQMNRLEVDSEPHAVRNVARRSCAAARHVVRSSQSAAALLKRSLPLLVPMMRPHAGLQVVAASRQRSPTAGR